MNQVQMSTKTQVRLYALLARKSPRAVIFRRGPSQQVQLISWNTENDTFEFGQWFKGRIYERRCDLSPNGDLLLYFAAKYKNPLYSWTAISRSHTLPHWPFGERAMDGEVAVNSSLLGESNSIIVPTK
jgi:hypothetical protein